jgi:glucan phosphoethanolaminetransferase (alkaline phosphatase superfamily)
MLKEPNLQEKILARIHGGVPMRSRAYFLFRAALAGVAALLVLAGALFTLSFLFFSVRESGVGYLLEFGEHGISAFVALFPWVSLLLFVVFVVILELLVRRFEFSYRFPLLRIFLWILIIGIAGSTIIGFTPLHSSLLSAADKDELPLLGPWYEQIHDSHVEQGVYRGDITTVAATYFVISHNDTDNDSDEGEWSIVPPSGFATSTLSVGEKAYVAGQLKNGVVYAYGIHIVTDSE